MTYTQIVLGVIAVAVVLLALNWVLTHLALILAVLLLAGGIACAVAITTKAMRIW